MHHSQVIELVWRNYANGNKLFVLHCKGDLVTCPQNPEHDLTQCRNCIATTHRTIKRNLPPGVTNIFLNLQEELIDENLLLGAFTNQNVLKDFTFNDIPFGKMVLNQLVDKQQDIVIPESVLKLDARKLLVNSLKLYKSALNTLVKNEINEVYVWNGRRSSDGPVIYAAKELGLKCNTFISGSKPNRIWVLGDFIHSIPANNEDLNRVVASELQSSGRTVVVEQAKEIFDSFEKGTSAVPGIRFFGDKWKYSIESRQFENISKPRLVIFTSSLWEFYSTYSSETVPEDFLNPYHSIEKICNDYFILQNFEIIVRWHPNLSTSGFGEKELMNNTVLNCPHAKHLLPDSPFNSYQLINSADFIVTYGSTIGIEAAYRGKISILLGSATYKGIGAVYEPKSYLEFIEMLNKADLGPLPITRAEDWAFWFGTLGSQFGFVKYISRRGFFLNRSRISIPKSFFGKLRDVAILIFNKFNISARNC